MKRKFKQWICVLLCFAFSFFTLCPIAMADGATVLSNEKAKVDVSNAKNGYILVAHNGQAKNRLKVRVTGPSGTVYTYDLNKNGQYETFPLSDGNGKYTVGVYENTSGNKYALAYSTPVTVMLTNDYAPFLHANQYVNYTSNSQAVKKAAELTKDKKTSLDKITVIYEFVVSNLTYDKQKAKNVQSGYLPNVDKVLAEKKGICFDYAALMTAMLRSQGIPTKLVVGYTGDVYHAWINTFIPEKGWVEGIIFFDGTTWKLMDPTFASSANQSKQIMEYIGNGSNYSAKYVY